MTNLNRQTSPLYKRLDKKIKQSLTKEIMINNNTKLKELPKDIKFATFNSNNDDIILGEYIIATLLYNKTSLNQILESANEIQDKEERENVKKILLNIITDFINLNPDICILK